MDSAFLFIVPFRWWTLLIDRQAREIDLFSSFHLPFLCQYEEEDLSESIKKKKKKKEPDSWKFTTLGIFLIVVGDGWILRMRAWNLQKDPSVFVYRRVVVRRGTRIFGILKFYIPSVFLFPYEYRRSGKYFILVVGKVARSKSVFNWSSLVQDLTERTRAFPLFSFFSGASVSVNLLELKNT